MNPIGIFFIIFLNRAFEYYRYDYNNFLPLDSLCPVGGGVKLGVQRTVSLYNGIANTPCFVFPFQRGQRADFRSPPRVTSMCFP